MFDGMFDGMLDGVFALQLSWQGLARGALYSYGPFSYGLYSYGPFSYGSREQRAQAAALRPSNAVGWGVTASVPFSFASRAASFAAGARVYF